MQAFNVSGSEVAATLFPNDMMMRASSCSLVTSDDDAHPLLYRVEDNLLTIRVGVKEKISNGILRLSQLLPGGDSAPTYKSYLPIHLGTTTVKLGPYGIFCVNGWKFCGTERDLTSMTVDNISLALACQNTSEGDSNAAVFLNDLHATVKSTDGARMLKPDLSLSLALTLCVRDTKDDIMKSSSFTANTVSPERAKHDTSHDYLAAHCSD